MLEQLGPAELKKTLVSQAVAALPEPLIRRKPTLSNPFVRGKVYELACGEPLIEHLPPRGSENQAFRPPYSQGFAYCTKPRVLPKRQMPDLAVIALRYVC